MGPIGGWEVVGELARGAQGVVLDVRDGQGGRAALKLLLQAEPRDAERLEREARLLAGLSHPAIPRVLGHGMYQAKPWVALERIDGEDLQRRVAREGPLPAPTAATIAEQVARGLAHLHERGVLHRDVKPANVILEPATGRVVLVDLGLARPELTAEAEGLTRTGELLGTPSYMAPEQVSPGAAWGDPSPASDVWGLGATLFHLMVGRPPFAGPGVLAVFKAILQEDPPLASLPRGPLAEVCARCLEKDPASRPTARDLADALARAARRGPRRRRRGHVLALSSAGLVAVCLALRWSGEARTGGLETEAAALGTIRSAIDAGDLAHAHALCELALERFPGQAGPFYARGLLRARSGELAEAEADFDRALELDPDHARSLARRGSVRILRGRASQAQGDLQRAVLLDPSDADAWQALGVVHLTGRRYTEGLPAADRALALAPGNHDARWLRVQLRERSGDVPGALADLDVILSTWPEDVDALLHRGRLRRGPEGARDLLLVTKLRPDDMRGWRQLATLRLTEFDPAAWAACERWQALAPRDPLAWVTGATARIYLKDVPGALEQVQRALELDPGCIDALHARAVVLLRAGRPREAADQLEVVLSRDPSHGGALLDRAALRAHAGDGEGALADAERSLRATPTGHEASGPHAMRGQALSLLGRHAEARAALDRSLALDPVPWQVWLLRAEARLALGDLTGARDDAREARRRWGPVSQGFLTDGERRLARLVSELGIEPD